MNTIKNLFSACVSEHNMYKKNDTPPAEYLPTLKYKYPEEFAKISESLNNFTDEEIYLFINYIFEYSTEDSTDTQYMLIPEIRTKTILFGLNLFNDIYELGNYQIPS